MGRIGKLVKVPLRDLWKHEADHFTTWLEENIDVLSESIGVKLNVIEREKAVGTFFVDLLAEDSQGNNVIIENQLERTDHTHLGQIITYLTNLEAKTAIWITKEPRQEHINAINWLNETTNVDFYLIKLEAYKIDESPSAPFFSIICKPDRETKELGVEKKELAERHHLRLDFWTLLIEKCKTNLKLFASVKPNANPRSSLRAGKTGKAGINYNFKINIEYGAVNLYIDTGYREKNQDIFDELFARKKDIEHQLGQELRWEKPNKDRRIGYIQYQYYDGSLRERDKWDELQNRMIEGMEKFQRIFSRYVKE
ncbi:MAG: hypothetical protein IEMM0008_1592 [bacterium]|nr:MAG: hypothetical protein IEMM0008_1592 [bacterium]